MPISLPKWQNINCVNNLQFQYLDPATVITKISTMPDLVRGFEERRKRDIKNNGDNSREIIYSFVIDALNRYVFRINYK